MLLGKRPRHQIKRTTSMTEFAFDPSKPSPVEFAVSPPLSESESSAASPPLVISDQRITAAALISPRVTRRHSADYGLASNASHFLKSCCLCERRFIPGHDIYMYRGDSAFCSLECRQKKMSQDERKERMSMAPATAKKAPVSPASRSKAVSTAEGETATRAAV
ncbi:hypothetical protein V2J09_017397 [Rumex salicifolius]